MACFEEHAWQPSFEGMTRRDRMGGVFRPYVPDPLAGWELELPADLVAAAAHIKRTPRRTGDAIEVLLKAGVLVQRNVGRERYRVFEVPDVIDLLTSLERRLASPEGNTQSSPVVRRVPNRPGAD
jgi:hypothetical protein